MLPVLALRLRLRVLIALLLNALVIRKLRK